MHQNRYEFILIKVFFSGISSGETAVSVHLVCSVVVSIDVCRPLLSVDSIADDDEEEEKRREERMTMTIGIMQS